MADKELPVVDDEFNGAVLGTSCKNITCVNFNNLSCFTDDLSICEFSDSFVKETQNDFLYNELTEARTTEIENQAIVANALRYFNDTLDCIDEFQASIDVENDKIENLTKDVSDDANNTSQDPDRESDDSTKVEASLCDSYQEYTARDSDFEKLIDEMEYQKSLNKAMQNFNDTLDEIRDGSDTEISHSLQLEYSAICCNRSAKYGKSDMSKVSSSRKDVSRDISSDITVEKLREGFDRGSQSC